MKIAFYKGKKRLNNKIISWWMNGKYSHAELILEDLKNGASWCVSSSSQDGGVRVKEIFLKPEHWDIVEVGGDKGAALRWYLKHRNTKYDWFGLLGFIYRRYGGQKKKWFCSEAIMSMLGYEDAWRFEPNIMYAFFNKLK